MVVSVVGDISVDEVANHVERYFGAAEREDYPAPDVPAFEPPGQASLIVSDLEKEQAHVIVGYPAPLLSSDELYALDLLYAVLSGQGGRLFYELRDRQSLAYSVFATRTVGLDASTFSIRIATSPEKITRAVEGIHREVDRLKDEGITQQELDRAKRFLIGNHDIGLQRNSSRAMTFGLDELYGLGYRRSLDYGDAITAVTVDDVQSIVDKWLDPNKMLVSIVKPSKTTIDADSLGLVKI